MRIEFLSDRLEALGLGKVGKSIFEHEMPAECRTGVLLKLPLQGIPIDHELPGYFRGSVQAIVRAQQDETGRTLADKVMAALTITGETFTSDGVEMRVNFLRPKTLPVTYPRSDGNGKEWSINLDASYVMS